MKKKEVGRTQNAGYQAGARRTFSLSLEEAWNLLISRQGLEVWLGTSHLDKWETGLDFGGEDEVHGTVRVFKVYSHIRLSWQRRDWTGPSVLQVRIIPAGKRTTISFHQEHLPDARLREEMKAHWHSVLDELGKNLRRKP